MNDLKHNHWKKLPRKAIRDRVFEALDANIDFYDESVVGVPASHLDPQVFQSDAPFLEDAPFLSALIRNPNHIGCHTTGSSEPFFKGTHAIEAELIELCAEKILNGTDQEGFDGYVASGGTEANIQAAWIYRNLFMTEYGAKHEEIAILCSSDSHYSQYKAANLLGIRIGVAPVNDDDRLVDPEALDEVLDALWAEGVRYLIVYANMMTTMFGSVDDPDRYIDAVRSHGFTFRMHVDGAYGGFFYPFTDAEVAIDFANPNVSSVTLDAHKMVQAPYGTGIFLVRKGLMSYATTREASYVAGQDSTLIGSRSGANAIAIWMILMTYGRFGWEEKISTLAQRAGWFSRQLKKRGISHYKEPYSNIVTIRSEHVPENIVKSFGLVPDDHSNPKWVKVVVMEHVTKDILLELMDALPVAVES